MRKAAILLTVVILMIATMTVSYASFGGNNAPTISGPSSSSSTTTTSSGGGGGGGGGTGGLTTVSVSKTPQAYTVKKGDTLSFTVATSSGGTGSHSIKVKSIVGDQVTLTFASTPFDVDFISGETKNVDIDQDSIFDLEVKATKLSAANVKVQIKQIETGSCTDGIRNQNEVFTDCGGPCDPCTEIQKASEETVSEQPPEAPAANTVPESATTPEASQTTEPKKKSKTLLTIAILLVVGVAGYFVYTKKKDSF